MGRNVIETIMGAVVLAVAGFFLVFAYTHADLRQVKGYEVSANFSSVGGLAEGADIRINGVKVGTVASRTLDPVSFSAVVRLTLSSEIQLPVDTVASIASDGLLGGKFVKLEPGRSKDRIAPGGTIQKSKDFRSIEEMVGELIFLATSDAPPPAGQRPPPSAMEPASGAGAATDGDGQVK